MSRNKNFKMPRRVLILILALCVAAVLALATGTVAWLTYDRSLLTATKIQFSTIDLEGQEIGSVPINLGEIDVRTDGSKSMPFRVRCKPNTPYLLQLGHTTNLPSLSYKIYRFDTWQKETWEPTPGSDTPIDGAYLNKDVETGLANRTGEYHDKTYSVYTTVQKNAEPLYWQSTSLVSNGDNGIDNYVLVVSWTKDDSVTDKETEMIYLTAGLGGYSNETAEATP